MPPASPRYFSSTSIDIDKADSSPALAPIDERDDDDDYIVKEGSEPEDDPNDYDLLAPEQNSFGRRSLEALSELLFSRRHLEAIFADPLLLSKFTDYLTTYRQQSTPIIMYYLDVIKALKAISYSNAITSGLDPISNYEFTSSLPTATVNSELQNRADRAFDLLVQEDLPAYVTNLYVNTISRTLQDRVTDKTGPDTEEISEGQLAEVFCLSDPSRSDNPIVFASEGMVS